MEVDYRGDNSESEAAGRRNFSSRLNDVVPNAAFTWKFGTLTTQVKKTGVELKNDDINSSNKSQGGTL